MSHIFISYSKNDIAFARHLRRLLEAEGFSVWMDETRLVPAERWWPMIETNVRSCAAFIVIMSGHSKQSVWVEREVLVAEEEDVKKPIFPILLAGKRWARLAEKQYEDMTGGVNAALSPRLIGGLAQYAPRTREPAPPPLPGPLLETGQQPIAEPATTSQTGRRVPALVWGVALAAVIGLVGLFALNGRFGGGSGETPTSPATMTEQAVGQVATDAPTLTPTDTPPPTDTPTPAPTDTPVPPTLTGSPTPTQTPTPTATHTPVPPTATNTPAPSAMPTATLSQTEEAATVNALIQQILTEEAATVTRAAEQTSAAATVHAQETAAAATAAAQATVDAQATRDQLATLDALATANAQTATATWWTHTPTPDYRLTAEAQLAMQRTATQAALDATATATQWTPTPAPGYPGGARITANGQWTPVERAFDGVTMVLVPVGCFMMGSEDGDSNELPVHQQCFDEPLWIDKYEVTNGQFGSVGCQQYSSDPNQPRNCVNWFDARDYCESRGARLPTETEWEYAARGPDSLVYPWGNTYDADRVIGEDDPTYGDTHTAPVGSRSQGASWVGALDMSGNVWEWVSSVYLPYPYDAGDGREVPARTHARVLRGGSFGSASGLLRAANRNGLFPDDGGGGSGFRCARSA